MLQEEQCAPLAKSCSRLTRDFAPRQRGQSSSHPIATTPFRAAARNNSTAWSGGADHSFASAIGAHAAQIDDRRMAQVIDEVRRKSMRGRVAREFRAKRIESLAGGGLRQVLDAPARDERGTVALANDPLDPRRSLAELSVKDACMLSHKAQEAGGLGHAGEDQPTAFAFGNELTSPLPAPHRAVLIVSDLEKAMVLLPFAKILLPSRRERPDLAADKAADSALIVDPFLKPKGGEAAQLPKAGAVGDERPNRRRRLGEMLLPAVAVDGAAIPFHAALVRCCDRASAPWA